MKQNFYRPDIDGLRAFAVLAVVLFHAFPNTFPGGFIGVDVFFVISGYLITSIILQDIHRQQFSLVRFYQKRIKRIFPALLVFLFACLCAGFYLLFDTEYAHLAKHIYSSTLFVNNFVLIHEAGYFDKISDLKPLLHLWSLGIEEQFYLIWPILVFLLSKSKKSMIWGMLGFIIISFGINLLRVQHHAVDAFFSPQSRIWELAFGGILAYLQLDQKFEKREFCLLNLAGFILLLGLVFKFSQSFLYPSWYACLPCFAAMLLICFPSKVNHYILSHPKMIFIGLMSYPLYLWHWGLLSFARIIYGGKISGPLTIALVLLSIGLSWLTYRFVEYPIRYKLNRKYENRVVGFLLLGLLGIGIGGYHIFKSDGLPKRSINQVYAFKHDLNNFDSYQSQAYSCQYLNKKSNCWKKKPGKSQAVVWGDSHAEHLYPGLLEVDNHLNWMLLERSGCPPFLGVRAYWHGQKDGCYATNIKIINAISKQSAIKDVVLGFVGLFYLSEEKQSFSWVGETAPKNFHLEMPSHPEFSKKEVFIQGLENTVAALEKLGKNIILVEDIPLLPFMPEACISRPLKYQTLPCNLPKSFVWQAQQEYHAILLAVQAKHPGVKIFSGIDAICDKRNCQVIQNHHLVYRDSHHLSLAGSKILAQAMLESDFIV
jgi:peptidoglycan/LPS O-acetylase OafA/YrhL